MSKFISHFDRLDSKLYYRVLLIRRKRESRQRERALEDHLSWQIKFYESQYALLAERLRYQKFLFGPPELNFLEARIPADARSSSASYVRKRPLRASSRVLTQVLTQDIKSLKSATAGCQPLLRPHLRHPVVLRFWSCLDRQATSPSATAM